jgi:cytochrome P450
MKVSFVSVAESEMLEAYEWYDNQLSGLGADFLLEVNRVVSRIRRYPESTASSGEGVRRVQLNKFPYTLWYAIEEGEIIVYAVAHMHRHPRYWRDRL